MPWFKSARTHGTGESWMMKVKAKFQTDVLNNNGLRKDGKNVNICFGNQAADMDTINTSLAVAFFLSNYHTEDEIKAGPDKKNNTSIDGYGDMVVPITSIKREEFQLRPDSVLCFKTAGWEFDALGAPRYLIFKDDLKNSKTKKPVVLQKPLVTLTDHNTHVPQLWTNQLFEEEVVRIVDHHVGAVNVIQSQFNANYDRTKMKWVPQSPFRNGTMVSDTYPQNHHRDPSCGSAATMVSEPLSLVLKDMYDHNKTAPWSDKELHPIKISTLDLTNNSINDDTFYVENTARVDYQGKATWMQNADGKPLQPVSSSELLPQDICFLLISTIIIDTRNFKTSKKAFNDRDKSLMNPVYHNPQFLPRVDDAQPETKILQSPTSNLIAWDRAKSHSWYKHVSAARQNMDMNGPMDAADFLNVDAKQSFLKINENFEISYCIANIFEDYDAWHSRAFKNLQRDIAKGTMKSKSTAAFYKERQNASAEVYEGGCLYALEDFMFKKDMLKPGCVLMGKTNNHKDAVEVVGPKAFFVAVPIETNDKHAAAAKLRLENILAFFKDANLAHKIKSSNHAFEIPERFAQFRDTSVGLQVSKLDDLSMPITVGENIVAAAFTVPGQMASRKLFMPILKWIEEEQYPATVAITTTNKSFLGSGLWGGDDKRK